MADALLDLLHAGNQAFANMLNVKLPYAGSKLATPADVVKPGLSDEVLQRLALMRPPVVNGVSEIRWGKPSDFDITTPNQPTQPSYTSVTVNMGTSPQPDDIVLYTYNEVWRQESDVRVENPDDPEQYVMVARTESIIFESQDDGFYLQFNFTNPARAGGAP